MPSNIRIERPSRPPTSHGLTSRAITPKDITPDDASWADRQERDINSNDCERRQDALLDEAIELSFPASDPVAELPQLSPPVIPRDSQEALLDEAIELAFPASDPIAVANECVHPPVNVEASDPAAG